MSLLTVFGVQAGILVVHFPFLQTVLGWSAPSATLEMLPMALLMMFSSVIAPRVATSFGSRVTMAVDMFLVSAALVLMALLVSSERSSLRATDPRTPPSSTTFRQTWQSPPAKVSPTPSPLPMHWAVNEKH